MIKFTVISWNICTWSSNVWSIIELLFWAKTFQRISWVKPQWLVEWFARLTNNLPLSFNKEQCLIYDQIDQIFLVNHLIKFTVNQHFKKHIQMNHYQWKTFISRALPVLLLQYTRSFLEAFYFFLLIFHIIIYLWKRGLSKWLLTDAYRDLTFVGLALRQKLL